LFPDRVRALVLDGALDPSLDFEASARSQALGFERALDRFLEACAGGRSCPFGSGDPDGAFGALVARVDAAGVPAARDPDRRRLTPSLLDLGLAAALYRGEEGWPELAAALAAAEGGDGTAMLVLADDYLEREP